MPSMCSIEIKAPVLGQPYGAATMAERGVRKAAAKDILTDGGPLRQRRHLRAMMDLLRSQVLAITTLRLSSACPQVWLFVSSAHGLLQNQGHQGLWRVVRGGPTLFWQ